MTRTPSSPAAHGVGDSRPIQRVTGTPSGQLLPAIEIGTYRPRGMLVAGLLVVPATVVLGVFAAALILGAGALIAQALLATVGAVVALWLVALLVLAPLFLLKIQAQGDGLVVMLPFGGQRRLRWSLIDRVERRFGLLWIHASDGGSVRFFAGGLEDGSRLLRQTVLRVAPSVLSDGLRSELAAMGGASLADEAQPTRPFVIAPIWFGLASIGALVGCMLAVAGTFMHHPWLLALGVVAGLFGADALLLCRQQVLIDSESITVISWNGRARAMLWTEIRFIEQVPPELRLALRGVNRRITLIGPFFMTALDRDRLRDLFHERLLSHGVPIFDRMWV